MIRQIIDLYIIITIAEAIISYFPALKVQPWYLHLRKMTEFTQKPVRRILPPGLPIDPAPLVVIVLLQMIKVLW